MAKLNNRYELKDVLGRGAMGVVYSAEDTLLQRTVAIKTIRDVQDDEAVDLFRKECSVLASITHPNVIEIYDIGEILFEGGSKP
jgi:eukaryotic-like serine/threonine-protein kinase